MTSKVLLVNILGFSTMMVLGGISILFSFIHILGNFLWVGFIHQPSTTHTLHLHYDHQKTDMDSLFGGFYHPLFYSGWFIIKSCCKLLGFPFWQLHGNTHQLQLVLFPLIFEESNPRTRKCKQIFFSIFRSLDVQLKIVFFWGGGGIFKYLNIVCQQEDETEGNSNSFLVQQTCFLFLAGEGHNILFFQ